MKLDSDSALDPALVGARLAESYDRAYWNGCVDERRFPTEVWRALGHEGWLGVLVPREAGGLGLGLVEMTALTRGLARSGFPFLTMITGPGLALPAIANAGSEAARSDLLPTLLAGGDVLPFAITERHVGSNLFGLETYAKPDGEGFVLHGEKHYTSLAEQARHILVLARSDGPDEPRAGFTLALVPTDADGFERTTMPTRISMPERQSCLRFEGVRLTRDQIVGEPGAALLVLRDALVAERLISGALSCGLGDAALARAVDHVRDRVVGRRPLGARQGVQHPLARAAVGLEAAWGLVERAARTFDAGEPADALANMALVAAREAGFAATDAALQAEGGSGFTVESETLVDYQMARLLRAAPVHAEGALNAVAEQKLGLPRSD